MRIYEKKCQYFWFWLVKSHFCTLWKAIFWYKKKSKCNFSKFPTIPTYFLHFSSPFYHIFQFYVENKVNIVEQNCTFDFDCKGPKLDQKPILWGNGAFFCIKPICCSWYMPNLMADVWHYAVGPFGPNQKAKMGPRGLQKVPKTAKISFFTFLTSPVDLNWPDKASIDCLLIGGCLTQPFATFWTQPEGQKASKRVPEGSKRLRKAPKTAKISFFTSLKRPVGLNWPHMASIGCLFVGNVWNNHLPPFGPNQKAKRGHWDTQ